MGSYGMSSDLLRMVLGLDVCCCLKIYRDYASTLPLANFLRHALLIQKLYVAYVRTESKPTVFNQVH